MRLKIDVSMEQKTDTIKIQVHGTVPEMRMPKAIHVNNFKSIFLTLYFLF